MVNVMHKQVYSGFESQLSKKQSEDLLNLLFREKQTDETVTFICNIPDDLAQKVFAQWGTVSQYIGWHWGSVDKRTKEFEKVIGSIWSASYGTSVYFGIGKSTGGIGSQSVKSIIGRLRHRVCGFSSIVLNLLGYDDIGILLKHYRVILKRGHDGESLEVYSKVSDLNGSRH